MEKILISKQGKKFFVKDASKDYHTEFGLITKDDLNKKDGSVVKTNTEKEFYVFSPSFIDRYNKIKRGAQIITKKDIGLIIANTGVNKTSKCLDAGAGSGALSCALANICKEVIAYEIRGEFIKTVEHNIELLGLKNLKLKNKDIYEGIDENDFDLITLDLPEPWRVLEHAEKALNHGGFLVCYLPSVTQVSQLVDSVINNENFIYLKTSELLERQWKIDGKKIARPESQMIAHTGFLIFIRRV